MNFNTGLFSLGLGAACLAFISSPAVGADTSFSTDHLQINFNTSASSFGLNVVEKATGRVLLNQSSIVFGSTAVSGVNSSITGVDGAGRSYITFNLKVGAGTATATYTALDADHLQVKLAGASSVSAIAQNFADLGADERFYGTYVKSKTGTGTVDASLDNRGLHQPYQGKYNWGDRATYGSATDGARAPFYFTNRNVGVYANTTEGGSTQFAYNGVTSLKFNGSQLTYDIFRGDSPKEVLQTYNQLAGGSVMPPTWAFGSVWWRGDSLNQSQNSLRGQALLLDDANKLQQFHIPAGALTLDRPFGTGSDSQVGGWGNYDMVASAFPNPAQMVTDLRARGLNLMVWTANRLAAGQLTEAQNSGGLYKYFPGYGSTPAADLRDPTTAAWFQGKLDYFVNLGIKGYKIDRGGESEMPDNVENININLFAKISADGLRARNGSDFFMYTRDINDKGRQDTAIWDGDADCSWHGLQVSLKHGIRAGLANFPIYGSDTGGYDGTPNRELFSRWLGMSAYNPLMEVMIGPSRTPWYNYGNDGEMIQITARHAQTHHDLIPYVQSLAYTATQTGAPIMRAMFLEFPADANPALADMSDQYMYGGQLLVAPVMTAGVVSGSTTVGSRSVYLPQGTRWVNYNNKSQVHEGGQTVAASGVKLDEVPVFAREGAVIPHGDILQANQNWIANWMPRLVIDVFPSDATGDGFDYYTGAGSETILSSIAGANRWSVQFGDLGVDGEIHVYLGRFFDFRGLSAVWMDGQMLTGGYNYDPSTHLLSVPFAGATQLTLAYVPEPMSALVLLWGAALLLPQRGRRL